MGETQNQPFQLSFNASLKVDFQGSRLTSDGGLILVRELDERLGFGELIEQHLTDLGRGRWSASIIGAAPPSSGSRGQASGDDDAAELPSLSVQPGAAVAERDRLLPREFVAAEGRSWEEPIERETFSGSGILRSVPNWLPASTLEGPDAGNPAAHCLEKRSGIFCKLIGNPKWKFRSKGARCGSTQN